MLHFFYSFDAFFHRKFRLSLCGNFPRQRKHLGHRQAVFFIQLDAGRNPHRPSFAFPCLARSGLFECGPPKPCVYECCRRHPLECFREESQLPDGDGEPPLIGYRLRLPFAGRFPFGTEAPFARSPNLSVSGAMASMKISETVRISSGSSSKMSHTSSSV